MIETTKFNELCRAVVTNIMKTLGRPRTFWGPNLGWEQEGCRKIWLLYRFENLHTQKYEPHELINTC